jgi:two-component system chemotaxis response regulator CheY
MHKVLVVDDSITVARQLQKILESSGDMQFIGHAKNGAEALKMKAAENPDIICMDMSMPIMDGVQTLRAMIAKDPNAKVVMISSLAGVGDKFNEVIKLGAKNVLAKPFEAEQVLATLRAVLAGG